VNAFHLQVNVSYKGGGGCLLTRCSLLFGVKWTIYFFNYYWRASIVSYT